MSKTKLNSGQSLFELVLSFAVVTLIVVGIVSAATIAIRNAAYSRNKTLADRYLQEALEWLRSEKNKNYTDFQSHTSISQWCLKSLDSDWVWIGAICQPGQEITGTMMRRELTFSKFTKDGKEVIETKVVVYWTDAQGRHESSAVTDFTNWQ